MFSGNVENIFGSAALESLIERVELLRFRQLRNVSCVNQKRRRGRNGIDAIKSKLEGGGNILVCLLVKANVAVADLQKTEIGRLGQRGASFRTLSKSLRRKDS